VTGGGSVARAERHDRCVRPQRPPARGRLGTTAGTNTLEATVAGLPVVPLHRHRNAGPAASICDDGR
jgi:hypothetical protein